MQEQVTDRLLLVGTAHVSPESVREVEAAIASFKPDVVAVELDPLRLAALEDQQRWESTPVHKLLKGDKLWLFLVQILLASYQRRLGEQYGAQPGAEMLAAVRSARAAGHDVLLADRDVGITMKRAFRGMRFGEKARLSWEIFKALFGGLEDQVPPEQVADSQRAARWRKKADFAGKVVANLGMIAVTFILGSGILYVRNRPEVWWWTALVSGLFMLAIMCYAWVFQKMYERRAATEAVAKPVPVRPPADINDLTKEDAVTAMMTELGQFAPSIKRVVIDERDEYLATRIQRPLAEGKRVVGVIGAGHLAGIRERIRGGEGPRDLAPLEVVPAKRAGIGTFVFQWLLPLSIVVILGWLAWTGVRDGNWQRLRQAALYWIFFTGAFAALGTLLARGHPFAIITAFLAAPITTLHPTLAAGWFAGIVEAWVRTPTVADFQGLSRLKTMKEFFSNRVIRVVMVAALANLGAIAGVTIASYKVFEILRGP